MDQDITIEAPREYHPNNVMYWEPKSKELWHAKKSGLTSAGNLLSKAKMILEADVIEHEAGGWLIKPIEGYNKQSLHVKDNSKGFECDCQGFAVKVAKGEERICSHVLAVMQFIFIHSRGGSNGMVQ